MINVPVGSTVARVYYALPNHVGIIGPGYDDALDANIEALRQWAANSSHLAIDPPRVDERMVFIHPDGSSTDAVVGSHIVYETLTVPAPSSPQQRAIVAETAIARLIKHNEMAQQALADQRTLATISSI